MADKSLAAQKITSSSRLPKGLADDPPPSPSLMTAAAGAAGIASRRKSIPPPLGPSRKSSSYNFKHTDPPGTSLLTVAAPLVAPLATSPTPPGVLPGTPVLHAAGTGYTPPVPPNLDISDIAQPAPVRPNLREGSSYCQSLISPLPPIDEDEVFIPGKEGSPRDKLMRKRKNSGFFTTFNMDGVEELPILGRRRSGSGGFDEGWPLPPLHVAERGWNTPGDPRRSSMIAEGDLMPLVEVPVAEAVMSEADPVLVMQAGITAMVARDTAAVIVEPTLNDGAPSAEHTSANPSATTSASTSGPTSKSLSQTKPYRRGSAVPPLESSKASLGMVQEEPSYIPADTYFNPSFNGPSSRKPSENEDTSPRTRHNTSEPEPGPSRPDYHLLAPQTRPNSPVAEEGPSRPELEILTPSEIDGLEAAIEVDGETDEEDWHSIRSHMTRITTADANSVIFNMSMATPNLALPTPEELKAEWENKHRERQVYFQNAAEATQGQTSDSGGVAEPRTETPGTVMAGLGRIRSAYPFPRFREGKGKRKEVERPSSSNWHRSFSDMFKGNGRKARERREREGEARVGRMVEECYNRKVDLGSSSGSPETPPPVLSSENRSPWAQAGDWNQPPFAAWGHQPAGEGGGGGDRNPFHDNFANSDAASEIQSLSSSIINFLQNADGSYEEVGGLPAWMRKSKNAPARPTLDDLPRMHLGQNPIMSPALARLASGSRRTTGMVYMSADGRPIPHRELELSHEKSRRMSDNSSDEEREDAEGTQSRPRAMRYMRPNLESRRTSTVEMVYSGTTTARVVVQETRDSELSNEEVQRLALEAKLKMVRTRKRSLASLGRKKSVSSVMRRSEEEGSVRRRISNALQGGFGGRKMATDGAGRIGTLKDLPKRERHGVLATVLDVFSVGSENGDVASRKKNKRPGASLADEVAVACEGLPHRKRTTSFWRRRIQVNPLTGKLPVLKRMQEAIKRGNSRVVPVPPAAA